MNRKAHSSQTTILISVTLSIVAERINSHCPRSISLSWFSIILLIVLAINKHPYLLMHVAY
jgi:hypothetical protein